MDIDKKELYEIIGFLFVQNRQAQLFSEQMQKILEGKQKEVNILKEQLHNATNGPESES